MQTLVGIVIFLSAIVITLPRLSLESNNVLSASLNQTDLQPIKTQSRFEEKISQNVTTLPKEIVYQDDPDTEAGIENVIDEGADGKKIETIRTLFYEGTKYQQEIIDTQIIPAKNKTISRGTKIVWKILSTPDGDIRYWKKLRVWATHYDSHCPGCNEWTAIGLRQGKGIIAVDPKVIRLRSQVYIPGYGKALAGDTGGAIKGNIVDLGFEDAKTAGWSAKFTDVYLLN